MSRIGVAENHRAMEIRIVLAAVDPPSGRLHQVPAAAAQPIPFVGWLGLLRALSEVIGAPPEQPPATSN